MKERDYIIATELTRLRCAYDLLRLTVPGNAATVMGIPEAQAEAEYHEIMRRLDVWVARLEHEAAPDSRDKEPWRREWPGDRGPTE